MLAVCSNIPAAVSEVYGGFAKDTQGSFDRVARVPPGRAPVGAAGRAPVSAAGPAPCFLVSRALMRRRSSASWSASGRTPFGGDVQAGRGKGPGIRIRPATLQDCFQWHQGHKDLDLHS
jgi:hypothetical protein